MDQEVYMNNNTVENKTRTSAKLFLFLKATVSTPKICIRLDPTNFY